MHIAPSGLFNQAQPRFCLDTVGLDRIVFAVDYPFIGTGGVAPFFARADLPEAVKHKIAHENAERLLRL
ncbi:amidohydrolase family protein [Streptomyces sp. NPDC014748]|uniref:amidohydrolase family protein n=1 Tax=Streptomyces sp. NPDC014748 TaxID=3364905 RepID=UPI0036F8E601